VEFENAPGGEGSNHFIDPTNPDIVYSAGFYGTISRAEYDKPAASRAILSPRRSFPSSTRTSRRFAANGWPPSSSRPTTRISSTTACSTSSVPRSRRHLGEDLARPDHERPGDPGDIRYQTLFTISESPIKSGLIYAGTDDGRLWVTRDGGKAWTEITRAWPRASGCPASSPRPMTWARLSHPERQARRRLHALCLEVDDYGKTWISLAKGIPVGPANVIREDPVNKDILYVGTDMGVYVTTDGGKTWTVLGGNLPTVYAHDLIIHPRDNIIVVATHGRGMWALDATRSTTSRPGGSSASRTEGERDDDHASSHPHDPEKDRARRGRGPGPDPGPRSVLPAGTEARKANYELASRWTAARSASSSSTRPSSPTGWRRASASGTATRRARAASGTSWIP